MSAQQPPKLALPLELQEQIMLAASAVEERGYTILTPRSEIARWLTVSKDLFPVMQARLYRDLVLDVRDGVSIELLGRAMKENPSLAYLVDSLVIRLHPLQDATLEGVVLDNVAAIVRLCKPARLAVLAKSVDMMRWTKSLCSAICPERIVKLALSFILPRTVFTGDPWIALIAKASATLEELEFWGEEYMSWNNLTTMTMPVCPRLTNLAGVRRIGPSNSIAGMSEKFMMANAKGLVKLETDWTRALEALINQSNGSRTPAMSNLKELRITGPCLASRNSLAQLGLSQSLTLLGLHHYSLEIRVVSSLCTFLEDPAWLANLRALDFSFSNQRVFSVKIHETLDKVCSKRGILLT